MGENRKPACKRCTNGVLKVIWKVGEHNRTAIKFCTCDAGVERGSEFLHEYVEPSLASMKPERA